jgi:hypothetical protein
MRSNARTFTRWLGVLVAVIGAAASVALGYLAPQSSEQLVPYVVSVVLGVIGVVLVAVLSAWLLGTWRSLWIVPIAYFVGWLAANIIGNAIRTPQGLSDPPVLPPGGGSLRHVRLGAAANWRRHRNSACQADG